MVLYLSAGTESEFFRRCQSENLVKSGYQAQKFNQLIIEGLGHHTPLTAIGNLPYVMSNRQLLPPYRGKTGQITYETLGCRPGRLRKLHNFRDAMRIGGVLCRSGAVEGIVCDAINPLAALTSFLLGKRFHVPALAVVTDIPSYLSDHPSRLSRLAEGLMKRFDGYVLLTAGMNPIVNPGGKPYIVMEGLCDIDSLPPKADGIPEKRVLYTGSLYPGTGIENLIEGFQKYAPEGYTLALYGSGPMVKELEEKPPQRVLYGGAVANAEAVRLQQESCLLVNPRPVNLRHANLAFPSKVMEYMASGTPVLTTRLPGIPSAYFSYVYAAPEDTAEALGREIRRILELTPEERREQGQKAREFVLNQKNNVSQTGRILELIRRCGKDMET